MASPHRGCRWEPPLPGRAAIALLLSVLLATSASCLRRPIPPRQSRAPAPRSAPPTPEPRIDAPEHVVRAGETLSLIARLYGVSIEDLVALNGIPDPDVIHVGQRLVLSRPPLRVESPPRAARSELDVALDQAEMEIAQARFDEALRIAEAARQLVAAGAGGPETLARVEEITAYIHAARGDEGAAIHAYRRLLELDPKYRPPPSTPPKVRIAYERALALLPTDVGAAPR